MIEEKKRLIAEEVELATGAKVEIAVEQAGTRNGIRLWFRELGRGQGPNVVLKPSGLKRHSVVLEFGGFATPVVKQMVNASAESASLARSLVRAVGKYASVSVPDQSLSGWVIKDPSFRIVAERRGLEQPASDEALIDTCRTVVSPLLGAMAELIGYEEDSEEDRNTNSNRLEGAIIETVVKRRERNRRSRLLAIEVHGTACMICGLDPKERYQEAGSILEVHHLVPLSTLGEPREYDPYKDLVPLCPNCHRAVHTRRPVPFMLEEIRSLVEKRNGN